MRTKLFGYLVRTFPHCLKYHFITRTVSHAPLIFARSTHRKPRCWHF